MDDIDQIVLNLSRDDFESPATIVANVANDLQHDVSESEVFDAYRRLVASGLVIAYSFDSIGGGYTVHDSQQFSQTDALWFLAIKAP